MDSLFLWAVFDDEKRRRRWSASGGQPRVQRLAPEGERARAERSVGRGAVMPRDYERNTGSRWSPHPDALPKENTYGAGLHA